MATREMLCDAAPLVRCPLLNLSSSNAILHLQIVEEENTSRASRTSQSAVCRVFGASSTLDKLHPGQRLELPLGQV